MLQTVSGIHRDSHTFFSPRLNVLPFIEIRLAKQEDHDDLADVFNSQSETITEAYGEYFIAELIAAQNDNNKALVAQVKDKAVGLMGLTKEVDLKLLHKCFDLDSFDNLLKADYMDAVRARRDLIKAQIKREEDNLEIQKAIERRHQTLRCHIISQRMSMQEHLIKMSEQIYKMLDDIMANDDEKAKLTKESVIDEFFNNWLGDFEITNPDGEFFLDPENDDDSLTCNIMNKLEFLLHTLEMFGLPKGYIDGKGHHLNWENEKKAAQGRGKKKQKGNAPKKGQSKLQKLQAEIEAKKDAQNKPPTYFDLEPFKKSLKQFLNVDAEQRSALRTQFLNSKDLLTKVFKDEHGEFSFKRCIDTKELADLLQKAGFVLDQQMSENLSPLLLCFGDIEFENGYGDRVPPETDEQRRAKLLLEMKRAERAKAADTKGDKAKQKNLTAEEQEKKKKEDDDWKREEEKLIRQMKPSPPMKVLLNLTSIHDLLNSLDRMATYDRLLSELGITEFENFGDEDMAL